MAIQAAASPLSWKTVLTHVDSHPASAQRLEAAVALARRFDALLMGMGAMAIEPIAIADAYGFSGMDATALVVLREQAELQLDQAKKRFGEAVGDLQAEWRTTYDRPASSLARTARAADVIVAGFGSFKPADSYHAANPAEVALIIRRPVLVAPENARPLQAKQVVVAWKDSPESRGAVSAALPLLLGAEEILVVEICGKADRDDAVFRTEDVAAGLRRHGLAARGKAIIGHDAEVAALLNQEAGLIAADLIVAGCYGRSRLNEWLFGGATLDLLSAPERYLLLSH